MTGAEEMRSGRRKPGAHAAGFASLDAGDRRVFRHWAFAVGAIYSFTVIALLAMLVARDRATQHASVQSPAPAIESRSVR
jgi:hypothetical protein